MSLSIYDLYNDQLVIDQPYVDSCINLIETQITYQIAHNLEYRFTIDLTDTIGTLDMASQIRIKDQVTFYFRNKGIRTYIIYIAQNQSASPNITSSNGYPFAVNFNSQYVTNSNIIQVEWFIRDNREFAKAYV